MIFIVLIEYLIISASFFNSIISTVSSKVLDTLSHDGCLIVRSSIIFELLP